MISVDKVVERCCEAIGDPDPQTAVVDVMHTAVAHRGSVLQELQVGRDAQLLHQSGDLTVVAVAVPPGYWFWPHEHGMWAVTAMLAGAEDDRIFELNDNALAVTGGFRIVEGEVASHPVSVVHSAGNPGPRFAVGLHVFGGDPFEVPAREWDPETGSSRIVDADTAARRRAAADAAS